jgi:histidinol dehydrogenase
MIRVFEGASAYRAHVERSAGTGRRSRDVEERVRGILGRVRAEGDEALLALARELDSVTLRADELLVGREELRRMAVRTSKELRNVLSRAAANIRRYHERQVRDGFEVALGDGAVLGERVRPLESVGIYVPGGEASYPSSVLMNAVPARLAGVLRIAAVTPPGALERSPELAAAFELVGVDEVYRVGGAQAVGALAFGTASIRAVDKIVGPGNAYVAEAKRQVFGQVGIDAIAGPSEIAILADDGADAASVAADLLAQAEHGSGEERAVLVTTSPRLAAGVAEELVRQLESLPRRTSIERVLAEHGALVVVGSADEAVALVNFLAPEHLEILASAAEELASRVANAGAIFLGAHSPVALGDFYAGTNHVLPTGASARFASPLGVHDFVKRTSIVRYTEARLSKERSDVEAFARAEGFEAHARSIAIRFERREKT